VAGVVLAGNAVEGAECGMTARGTQGTPKKRETFLRALATGTMTVEQAAEAIGVDRRTVYKWRDALPEFRQGWDVAVDASADKLEARLHELALGGDVTALIFLLRSRKPEVYNPTLVLRRAMLELALAKARAETGTVPTIEGQAEARPMIYPVEARDQLEVPRLLRGGAPAPIAEIDDEREDDPEEEGAVYEAGC
jgi:transposase-like protein